MLRGSEWTGYRDRIRGIQAAITSGEADEDEPEALTIEKVAKKDPSKLEPLPPEQGLAVSLNYERGAKEHKFKNSSGGVGGKAKAEAKAKTMQSSPCSTARVLQSSKGVVKKSSKGVV